MTILAHFPHTCTAKKRKRTKGTLGGSKDSFPTTVFTDRKCWRQPVSDSENEEYQRRGITVSHKVYFTSDPELDATHVLIFDGVDYYVKSESDPDASVGLGVVWRVMVDKSIKR